MVSWQALPNTALGIVAGGGAYLAGRIVGTNPNTKFANNAVQVLNSPININDRAYTLGNVEVFAAGHGPEAYQTSYSQAYVSNGSHEEGHTLQAQSLGLTYLPAELIGSLSGENNPLEIGADKYAMGLSC